MSFDELRRAATENTAPYMHSGDQWVARETLRALDEMAELREQVDVGTGYTHMLVRMVYGVVDAYWNTLDVDDSNECKDPAAHDVFHDVMMELFRNIQIFPELAEETPEERRRMIG